MKVETEAAHRGAPGPTRGFPGGRQEWTPQSGLTSNTQPAVSPHGPKGSVPGAQGEHLLALGSLSSITTHSHPHKHISEGMNRPVNLSPCQSTSAQENVFQKQSLQNYFQLQPTGVEKPSVVTASLCLALEFPMKVAIARERLCRRLLAFLARTKTFTSRG